MLLFLSFFLFLSRCVELECLQLALCKANVTLLLIAREKASPKRVNFSSARLKFAKERKKLRLKATKLCKSSDTFLLLR